MEMQSKFGLLRRISGLTQQMVADELGVATHTVRRWEYGTNIPRRQYRESLAKMLKVSAEVLFEPDTKKSPKKEITTAANGRYF